MRFANMAIRPMDKIAGLILAGGASRRMGRDKAKLVSGGKTLVERMAAILQKAGCAPVQISGQSGIKDVYPGMGPLAGMHAAVLAIKEAKAIIIVPVDMPELSHKCLQKLSDTAGEAVFFEGQSLPLKLACTDQILERLERILRSPGADLSIRNFVRGLKATVLDASEVKAQELTNLNTLADVKNWEKSLETQA
jgi:molybdenum cofactor guanylyltransferase